MIYKYNFYGKVHPERVGFDITVPDCGVTFLNGVSGKLKFDCKKSNLILVFETETNIQESIGITTLRNDLLQHAATWVDAYCYLRSFNYDIEITGVRCKELDLDTVFGVDFEKTDELDEAALLKKASTDLSELFELIVKNSDLVFLKDVFADFRRAIKYPHMTGGFLYRSVETIRSNYFEDQSVEDDSKRIKGGWETMNNALGFETADYSELLRFRRPNMHGVYPVITSDERLALAKQARKMINKFIVFVKEKHLGRNGDRLH